MQGSILVRQVLQAGDAFDGHRLVEVPVAPAQALAGQ